MTVSGFNQDVEVLGRTFHLQTQVFLQPEPCIRTEVFHGGKLMARREAAIDQTTVGVDESVLRQMMKAQHLKILESVQARAKRYQQRQQDKHDGVEAAAPAEASPDDSDGDAMSAGILQTADDGAQVEIALGVRRLFECFRLRLERTPGGIGDRLEVAARQLKEVLESPVFPKIRVDEQVRFHLLNEQLSDWLTGHGDEALGRRIWAEIGTFNNYLAEVNNRSELAAFDRDLLRWALRKAEDEGISARTVEHLEMLYGRDLALDRMLDEPSGVGQEQWVAELERVLAVLG